MYNLHNIVYVYIKCERTFFVYENVFSVNIWFNDGECRQKCILERSNAIKNK